MLMLGADSQIWACYAAISSSIAGFLGNYSLAHEYVALVPGGQNNKIIIWRRQVIVMAIDMISAIHPKHDTGDSW
jgi:hypothetical protein